MYQITSSALWLEKNGITSSASDQELAVGVALVEDSWYKYYNSWLLGLGLLLDGRGLVCDRNATLSAVWEEDDVFWMYCSKTSDYCIKYLSVRVEGDAYIRGLTNNIKGEVTSSKPVNFNEAVRMAHKLMEQRSQAGDERILEGKKRKWENFQSGNSSGKSNHKDNSC
ncbi:hypothetical protein Tco_0455401 [Tanacetum coccineum]